ncbi:DUF504 domain-containing protein [Candidatus Woesearchaeota archaeon]|nr:DUF504 domain-containing protein [Candidatus Woesearchaeota archaeon]
MKIDTLLRAVYDKNFLKLNELKVIVKDRIIGEKEIDGSLIKEVTKGHFTLQDGTYIPSHRIIKIEKKKR